MRDKKYFYIASTIIFSVLLITLGWVYLVYGTTIGTDISTVNFLATGTSTLATTTIGTNFYIDETGAASTTGAVIFGSTLSVTSDTTLSGNVLIVGTSTLATTTIGTNFYIDESGNASTTGTFILGSTLDVTGVSTLSGGIVNIGTSTLATTTIGTNFYIDESGNASTTGTFAIGSGTTINKLLFGTVVIDPGDIATSTTVLTTSTVSGLTTDMTCFANPPDILNDDLLPKGATTTLADELGVYLYNPDQTSGGAVINDGALTWGYLCIK